MTDVIISPNMGLPVPIVSEEPGPDWATDINACMSVIDAHNHAAGSGVPITPDGISINSDLAFNNNNAISLRSARFTTQLAPLALATDLGCLYESGVDLYYNDGNGNQVRITQGGSVTGSSGTITGLPSGTASASYSAGTFTFQAATSTPATMNFGPIITGRQTAGTFTVTLTPSVSQGANYGMIWPTALPVSTSPLIVDASGNMSFGSTTGTGAFVQGSSPTISNPTVTTGTFDTPAITTPNFIGNPTGTILSASYVPTIGTLYVSGGTITITVNTKTAFYQRIGNYVSVQIKGTYTTSNYTSTANYQWLISMPTFGITPPVGILFDTGVSVTPFTTSVDYLSSSSIYSTVGTSYAGNGTGRFNCMFSYAIT